jgi:hypothetical protein
MSSKDLIEKNLYLFNAYEYMSPWQKHCFIQICIENNVNEKLLKLLSHPFFKGYSLFNGEYKKCKAGFRRFTDKGMVVYVVNFENTNVEHVFLNENTIGTEHLGCFEEGYKYGFQPVLYHF